ncbi:hypothetical protein D3C86_2126030 [compost metagenome]
MEGSGKIVQVKRDAMRLLRQCCSLDDTRIFCELGDQLQLRRIDDRAVDCAGKIDGRQVEVGECVRRLAEN